LFDVFIDFKQNKLKDAIEILLQVEKQARTVSIALESAENAKQYVQEGFVRRATHIRPEEFWWQSSNTVSKQTISTL
jgi:hypothetical protein